VCRGSVNAPAAKDSGHPQKRDHRHLQDAETLVSWTAHVRLPSANPKSISNGLGADSQVGRTFTSKEEKRCFMVLQVGYQPIVESLIKIGNH